MGMRGLGTFSGGVLMPRNYFVAVGSWLTFSHLLVGKLMQVLLRSHSWGTSFAHFVRSIRCHALSKEGPTSWIDAAYWICSFAAGQSRAVRVYIVKICKN